MYMHSRARLNGDCLSGSGWHMMSFDFSLPA